jgi:hypothetical protein
LTRRNEPGSLWRISEGREMVADIFGMCGGSLILSWCGRRVFRVGSDPVRWTDLLRTTESDSDFPAGDCGLPKIRSQPCSCRGNSWDSGADSGNVSVNSEENSGESEVDSWGSEARSRGCTADSQDCNIGSRHCTADSLDWKPGSRGCTADPPECKVGSRDSDSRDLLCARAGGLETIARPLMARSPAAVSKMTGSVGGGG